MVLSAARIERYQLEGQDPALRVFNRLVEINRGENGYTSLFSYEGTTYSSTPKKTIKEALFTLVESLQHTGFGRLRSRLNFRGKRYLAEREPWTDYPDSLPAETKKARR